MFCLLLAAKWIHPLGRTSLRWTCNLWWWRIYLINQGLRSVSDSEGTQQGPVDSLPVQHFYFDIPICAAKLLGEMSFGMVHTTRPLFQCCICVEVYLGVVRPVTFLQVKGLKYRVGISAVVWLAGLCGSIFFYLCNYWVGLPYVYLTEYLMLLSLKLFCCTSVIRTLRKPRPGEATAAAKSTTRKDIRRRALQTFSIILTTITLNYSINIILASFIYFLSNDVVYILYTTSAFVGIANGVVVPLIYASKVDKCTFGTECLVSCLVLGSDR